jgi:hypothetical protein
MKLPSTAVVLVSVLAQLIPSVAWAKDQSERFDKPAALVYEAAVNVAAVKGGVIIFSDKEHLLLTFKSAGYWNKGFELSVKVERIGENQSQVTLRSQKTYFGAGWGAADRINNEFYKQLREELAKPPVPAANSQQSGTSWRIV